MNLLNVLQTWFYSVIWFGSSLVGQHGPPPTYKPIETIAWSTTPPKAQPWSFVKSPAKEDSLHFTEAEIQTFAKQDAQRRLQNVAGLTYSSFGLNVTRKTEGFLLKEGMQKKKQYPSLGIFRIFRWLFNNKFIQFVTAAQKIHESYLDDIVDEGSLKGRLKYAYTQDQANYFQNQSQSYRLIALEQLLDVFQTDAAKSQYQKGVVQPIANISLASAYLAWWNPALQFHKPSDRLNQTVLSKVALMVQDLCGDLENCLTKERTLKEIIYFFNTLCASREAREILRYRLAIEKFPLFSFEKNNTS
jgi:hypothetical protein